MEPWIETYTGRKFYFDERMSPEQVNIFDIAHGLSNICRFSGQCEQFYSVAEHSLRVAHNVPRDLALPALLHDASEAYLSDIPSPVKQLLPDYKELERRLMDCIADAFHLPRAFYSEPTIKRADWAVLRAESRILLPSEGEEWFFPEDLPEDMGAPAEFLTPTDAKDRFLKAYYSVVGYYSRLPC